MAYSGLASNNVFSGAGERRQLANGVRRKVSFEPASLRLLHNSDDTTEDDGGANSPGVRLADAASEISLLELRCKEETSRAEAGEQKVMTLSRLLLSARDSIESLGHDADSECKTFRRQLQETEAELYLARREAANASAQRPPEQASDTIGMLQELQFVVAQRDDAFECGKTMAKHLEAYEVRCEALTEAALASDQQPEGGSDANSRNNEELLSVIAQRDSALNGGKSIAKRLSECESICEALSEAATVPDQRQELQFVIAQRDDAFQCGETMVKRLGECEVKCEALSQALELSGVSSYGSLANGPQQDNMLREKLSQCEAQSAAVSREVSAIRLELRTLDDDQAANWRKHTDMHQGLVSQANLLREEARKQHLASERSAGKSFSPRADGEKCLSNASVVEGYDNPATSEELLAATRRCKELLASSEEQRRKMQVTEEVCTARAADLAAETVTKRNVERLLEEARERNIELEHMCEAACWAGQKHEEELSCVIAQKQELVADGSKVNVKDFEAQRDRMLGMEAELEVASASRREQLACTRKRSTSLGDEAQALHDKLQEALEEQQCQSQSSSAEIAAEISKRRSLEVALSGVRGRCADLSNSAQEARQEAQRALKEQRDSFASEMRSEGSSRREAEDALRKSRRRCSELSSYKNEMKWAMLVLRLQVMDTDRQARRCRVVHFQKRHVLQTQNAALVALAADVQDTRWSETLATEQHNHYEEAAEEQLLDIEEHCKQQMEAIALSSQRISVEFEQAQAMWAQRLADQADQLQEEATYAHQIEDTWSEAVGQLEEENKREAEDCKALRELLQQSREEVVSLRHQVEESEHAVGVCVAHGWPI